MTWASSTVDPPTQGIDRLSRREREILDLLGSRRNAREIADELLLSRRTVETHLLKAFRKLAVHERSDAVAAYRQD